MWWPRIERILTQEEAQSLCAYWQALLRIQDWDVEVKIVRRPEFTNAIDCMGECNTWRIKKRAVIHLLHPEDHAIFVKNSKFVTPHDMEVTLVHELLHVALAPVTMDTVKADSPESIAEEQFIDALSRALVHLYRRTEPATVAPNQPGALPQHYIPLTPGTAMPNSVPVLTLRISNPLGGPPSLTIPGSDTPIVDNS